MNPFINMTAQKTPDPFLKSAFPQEKVQEDSGFLMMLQKEIRKDEPVKQPEPVREPEFKAERKTLSVEKSSEVSAIKERPDERRESVSPVPETKDAPGKPKINGKPAATLQAKSDVSLSVRKQAGAQKPAADHSKKMSAAGNSASSALKEKQAAKTHPVSEKKKTDISAEKEHTDLQGKAVPEHIPPAELKVQTGTDAGKDSVRNRLTPKEEIPAGDFKQKIPSKDLRKQFSEGRKDLPEQKIQTVPAKKTDAIQTAELMPEQKKKISGIKKDGPVHTETAGIKIPADKNETDSSLSRISVSSDSITVQDSGADKGSLAFRFAGNGSGDFKPGTSLQDAANLMKEQPGRFQEQLQDLMNGAKLQVKDSRNASLNINLYPRALGTLTLNLGLEQGILSGRFIVDSQEARELLNENMNFIKQQLLESGIQLGQFHVDVRDRGNHQQDRNSQTAFQFTEIKNENTEDPVSAAYEMNFTGSHEGSVNLII